MKEFYDWKNEINYNELNIAIDALKNNGLLLVPTETVYGIAANAYSNDACQKIFEAKGRAQDNPLIIHICNKEMIGNIAEAPNEIEEKLIDAFMPGPFTLILNKKDCICDVASANMPTIGVRMPSNFIIHEIIEKSNIPIAAPSANISGRPSGTCIEDIMSELKDRIDIIIDGGKCKIGLESTVVKVIDGVPTILRPGFVTEDDIKNAVGCVKLSDKLFKKVEKDEKVESPGMKYRHYAPKTQCILVSADNDINIELENVTNTSKKDINKKDTKKENTIETNKTQIEKINKLLEEHPNACVLGFLEDRKSIKVKDNKFINLGSKENLAEISQNVFSSLRKVDFIENCDLAIVEGVEKKDLGLSIMNRLIRACENNII